MLKVKQIRKIKGETPYDFFKRFFTKLPATYEVDGTLQCEEEKLRSYDELIRVFNYYFPDTEEKVFINALRELIVKSLINAVYCADIGKFTFFPLPGLGNEKYNGYTRVCIPMGHSIYLHTSKMLCIYRGYSKEDYAGLEDFVTKLKIQYPYYTKTK